MTPGATRTSLAAAGALVLLVALLATLQYRWIGEIRDAERDRMRASARAASSAVASDFDRELARALRYFGEPLRPDGAADVEPGLLRAWQRWASEARVPELVSGIAIVRRDDEGVWRWDEFDPSNGTLRAGSRPLDFEPIRRILEDEGNARSGPPPPPPDAPSGAGARWPRRMPFFHVLDAPPLLVIGSRAPEPDGAGSQGRTIQAALIRLDETRIAGQLLPELVARHFGDSSQYDVALVRRSGGPPLYRSRADYDPGRHTPDAAVPIFPTPFGRFGPGDERPGGSRPEGPQRDFLFRVPGPDVPPLWTLMAAHRAGSLDTAVNAARARNLAVSGGILVLLLIAGGMLLSSAHRSARIARQQVEFVASLTHELRTPLAAIRTAGENMSDGVVVNGERVREYGDLIQREGRRLSTLIEASLAHAGIEARGESVRAGSASLPDAVAEAIEACQPLARARGASVEASLPEDLPAVAGDEPALRTLIENLLSNAIKYGGDNGRVTVSARSEERHVRIAVRDRGPGIPDAELPRIFEPFYRGSGAGADGSGLGLALVRRIVATLGGYIAVESRPTDGTTFTILLPRAPAAAPERA